MRSKPIVYFARIGPYVKIGYTSNWLHRQSVLAKQYSTKVTLIYAVPGAQIIERAYRIKFKDCWLSAKERKAVTEQTGAVSTGLFHYTGRLMHWLVFVALYQSNKDYLLVKTNRYPLLQLSDNETVKFTD